MNKIPARSEALKILEEIGLNTNILNHSIAVSEKAIEIANKLKENNVTIDIELVEIGALLHDIGRARIHGWKHPIEGGEIIRELGFSEKLARIAETHILGGLSRKDCEILGLPVERHIPETIEEKVVCYADKLTKGTSYVDVEELINIAKKDTVVRKTKIGRNDPCPCGSNKKYKKCCGC